MMKLLFVTMEKREKETETTKIAQRYTKMTTMTVLNEHYIS